MMTSPITNFNNKHVTIMGLGINGGGLASARYFAEHGAIVTVTDMKDEKALAESIEALKDFDIRYVLGYHDEADFINADLVIKNPAVRPDNRFLALSKQVETDLSIFLKMCKGKVIAVTGSKGKSTTSSACAWILSQCGKKAFLGGNITVSPLSFIDKVMEEDFVVLELSSWQLGDLKSCSFFKPYISIITKIVPDHQDRYNGMEAYVADKKIIYSNQDNSCWTIYDIDDSYGLTFANETKAKALPYGSKYDKDGFGIIINTTGSSSACTPLFSESILVPEKLSVPGEHNKRNIAAAALAASLCDCKIDDIQKSAASFPGVEHRLEKICNIDNITWYNDSAATVPEAVQAALESFSEPVILITGGTDKKLNFETATSAYKKANKIILLDGTGSKKIISILEREKISYYGPYDNINQAIKKAKRLAFDGSIVVFSPGCTSFGMFRNEFDRGRCFKAAVKELISLQSNNN